MGSILDLVPLAQSAAILDDNIDFYKKKKKKSKHFIGQGVKNIVGIRLTKEVANAI